MSVRERREGGPARRASSGRQVAYGVVHRVLSESAFATPLLDAELAKSDLSVGERGRATDLTMGTLRMLGSLESVLEALRQKPGPLEPWTRAVLLVAAYELGETTAKSHAVVHEAVAAVEQRRGVGLAKFANAILRKLSAGRGEASRGARRLEVAPWLATRLVESVGAERHAAFMARPVPPPTTIRFRGDDAALARCRDELGARPGARIEPGPLTSRAWVVEGAGDLRTLAAYREGSFVVQDEGSQLIAAALEVTPGLRVLDACAGRGGKTLALGEALGGRGRLVAVDLHPAKLEKLAEELERREVGPIVETRAVDWSVGSGGLEAGFDRVLVDAPCTGLGTIHRRPEILLRVDEAKIAEMATLESTIVARAAALVAPGGLVVAAVCSPLADEARALVEAIATAGLVLDRAPIALRDGQLSPDDDGVFRVGPWTAGATASDAYAFVRARRPA